MNIGLLDADLLDNSTNFPNLSLLKISSYHKYQGNNVFLMDSYDNLENYDLVAISKVFDYTKVPVDLSQHKNVVIGGTGFFFDKSPWLLKDIEHSTPDYSLYDNMLHRVKKSENKTYYKDYSIGYLSRHCYRKCSFCVNRTYDKVVKWSPLDEFFDPSRERIVLLDDNIFGYTGYKKLFEDLIRTGRYFQFRQGLDFKLMTEEKADLLTSAKYDADYIFAFDNIEEKDIILRKLKIWLKYWNGNKKTKFYILCAFESQDVNDIISVFQRIKILAEHRCYPYIMRHKSYKGSEWEGIYNVLAAWCNQPNLFYKWSFREFSVLYGMDRAIYREYRNSWNQYLQDGHRKGKSWKDFERFEKAYPDVAKKYFDLKFSDLNPIGVKYREKKEIAELIIDNDLSTPLPHPSEKEKGVHELTDVRIDREFQSLIPPLTEGELTRLQRSILTEGCRDALVLWKDDKILVDGHNRYTICQTHGIPFKTIEIEFKNRLEAKIWIRENQLARRNFTDFQRTYQIGLLYKDKKKAQGGTGANQYIKMETVQNGQSATAEKIADEYKVGGTSVRRAEKFANAIDIIVENTGKASRERILGKQIPMTKKDILAIANLEPEKQKEVMRRLNGKKQSVASILQSILREETKETALPGGKFDVVLADPPWHDHLVTDKRNYPTMTIEEICQIPVKDISADNAILFLWSNSQMLEKSLKVLNVWGFEYRTNMVWVKDRHRTGNWFLQRHELLLIGVKSKISTPLNKPASVINVPRQEHSQKPEVVYEIIEMMFPNGAYLEVFSSNKREKWECWGNGEYRS